MNRTRVVDGTSHLPAGCREVPSTGRARAAPGAEGVGRRREVGVDQADAKAPPCEVLVRQVAQDAVAAVVEQNDGPGRLLLAVVASSPRAVTKPPSPASSTTSRSG